MPEVTSRGLAEAITRIGGQLDQELNGLVMELYLAAELCKQGGDWNLAIELFQHSQGTRLEVLRIMKLMNEMQTSAAVTSTDQEEWQPQWGKMAAANDREVVARA